MTELSSIHPFTHPSIHSFTTLTEKQVCKMKNNPYSGCYNQTTCRLYLPCTRNFSRGDFPATIVAKSDKRTREFIFPDALSALQKQWITGMKRCPRIRPVPREVPPGLLRPNPCWSRSSLVRVLRRQLSLENSGCQAPPRRQKAKGVCSVSAGGLQKHTRFHYKSCGLCVMQATCCCRGIRFFFFASGCILCSFSFFLLIFCIK